MDSASVAFDKFSVWKNAKTVLKLTTVTNGGAPDVSIGWIPEVDAESSQVAFMTGKMHDYRCIDFDDVSFNVSTTRVEATFGDDNVLILEETLPA